MDWLAAHLALILFFGNFSTGVGFVIREQVVLVTHIVKSTCRFSIWASLSHFDFLHSGDLSDLFFLVLNREYPVSQDAAFPCRFTRGFSSNVSKV